MANSSHRFVHCSGYGQSCKPGMDGGDNSRGSGRVLKGAIKGPVGTMSVAKSRAVCHPDVQ